MAITKEQLSKIKECGTVLIQTVYDSLDGQRDLIKIRIGIWDKLTVLNAGTLALSFTAASAFHAHANGDGGVGYLFASWKLLIISIGFACFAQHVAALALERLQGYATGHLFKRKLEDLHTEATESGVALTSDTPQMKSIKDVTEASMQGIGQVAMAAGFIAQILTVAAYFWLYRFARTNLIHL